MPTIKTQGIVLRTADYRDNDRMLTLLTPRGRMDVLSRGCRKNKSPLLAASECFAFGEYVLYQAKGRSTVSSCTLNDAFYPLREDYDKLKYAAYMLALCDAAAYPELPGADMFTLLIRSLTRIAYQDMDPRAVTAAFLLFLSVILGYRPQTDTCLVCGKEIRETPCLFDPVNGGLVCREHPIPPGAVMHPIAGNETAWIRDVITRGIEKTAFPAEDAPFAILKTYVETQMDKRIPAGRRLD